MIQLSKQNLPKKITHLRKFTILSGDWLKKLELNNFEFNPNKFKIKYELLNIG